MHATQDGRQRPGGARVRLAERISELIVVHGTSRHKLEADTGVSRRAIANAADAAVAKVPSVGTVVALDRWFGTGTELLELQVLAYLEREVARNGTNCRPATVAGHLATSPEAGS